MQSWGARQPRRVGGPAAATTVAAALITVVLSRALRTGQCHRPYRPNTAFLRAAEWMDRSELKGDDILPLTVDVTLDTTLGSLGSGSSINLTGVAGRGSYIADFGTFDVPHLGKIRARAGLRYSRLYPRGALELGARKEIRADAKHGYDISVGVQTAGDDRRLDVLWDLGALKHFRGARAFYRFLWGAGWPFYGNKAGGPSWHEMGSSLGVTQTEMPPGGRGELTVGWRTGLFDNGLEGVMQPSTLTRPRRWSHDLKNNLLDSTPFAAYGVDIPVAGGPTGHVSWTLLPEQDLLEHVVRLRAGQDASGGTSTFLVAVDQSLSRPSYARLRLGASYTRNGK